MKDIRSVRYFWMAMCGFSFAHSVFGEDQITRRFLVCLAVFCLAVASIIYCLEPTTADQKEGT